MKAVHHATRRAIEKRAIEEFQKRERIVVMANGRRMMDLSLFELRATNAAHGLPPLLTIDTTGPWRLISTPPMNLPPGPRFGNISMAAAVGGKRPTRWQKIKALFRRKSR